MILGMELLSPNQEDLDCLANIVTLSTAGIPPFMWKVYISNTPMGIITFVHAKILISRVC